MITNQDTAFFTDQLKQHEIGYPKYNTVRSYRVTYWEKDGQKFKRYMLGHISSGGANLAIVFDMSSNDFVLDSIAPM